MTTLGWVVRGVGSLKTPLMAVQPWGPLAAYAIKTIAVFRKDRRQGHDSCCAARVARSSSRRSASYHLILPTR
jgi:hypothetical protein